MSPPKNEKQFLNKKATFGNIHFFQGTDGGRYPFCNTLFIDDEIKAVIDPGCSQRGLRTLSRQQKIDWVILSHYHEDHTQCASYFDSSRVFVDERDLPGVQTVQGLMDCYGVEGTLDSSIWLNFLVHGLHLTDLPHAKPIREDVIDFGRTKAVPIHTPGHTPGHTCFHFPNENILYSADIDLDRFGPYYGDSVSSLSDTLASIDTVIEINPKALITGHQEGIVVHDTKKRLLEYRDKIFDREKLILKQLETPRSIKDLVNAHMIYGRQFEPRTIFNLIERNMIYEHLMHLVSQGRIEQVGKDLFVKASSH